MCIILALLALSTACPVRRSRFRANGFQHEQSERHQRSLKVQAQLASNIYKCFDDFRNSLKGLELLPLLNNL